MHCHLRDFGQSAKGTVATETAAAFASGFGAVVVMPNTVPTVDCAEMVGRLLSQPASVTVYPVGAVSERLKGQVMTDFEALESAGAVAFSDDGAPVLDDNLLMTALREAKALGKPLIYHSELGPDEMNAEFADVSRVVGLAGAVQAPVHVTHISDERSVQVIRAAKAAGIAVTCDTCPHYFSLTHRDFQRIGANARMNPPLKSKADVKAIIAGLIDGTIDCISTDHAPHTVADKDGGANGIIGFETAFVVAYNELVLSGYMALEDVVEKMRNHPARILGIPLPDGEFAFDENVRWVMTEDDIVSKSKNSPWIGREFMGRIYG